MAIDKSSIDITKVPKPIVVYGSEEDYYLAEDAAIRIFKKSKVSGLQEGDDGGGGPNVNDRPSLSDIESVVQSTYFDDKQNKTMAKVVIRIRNSSGKKLLGIDARTTIPVASGGQA